MSHPTVLGIGIANCTPDVDSEGLKKFIDSAAGDFETFSLAPAKPGVIRAAAFDYTVILYSAASVASIGSLLLTAYDKFIAPKIHHRDDAGLYIVIRKPDDSIAEFWIGRDSDKEIFIDDFASKITALRKSDDDPDFYTESEAEIKHSGIWIKRRCF